MAVYQTYNATLIREDLNNIITMITPQETPIFSGLGSEKATATYHEWAKDSLANAAANAQLESRTYSAGTNTAPVRTGAYTQILSKTFEVTDTNEAVVSAGDEASYEYRMAKAMKELARDCEYNIVNQTGNSGGSASARALKGILSWISTNSVTGTGTATEYLTKTMVDDGLQKAYDQGGKIDKIYCNSFQQRKFDSFTTPVTRNLDATTNVYTNYIRVYDSAFGTAEIIVDRNAGLTDKIIGLQSDMWKWASLRPLKHTEAAKSGSTRKGNLELEGTLVSKNEAASFKIIGLKTS